jgi:predicted DsbA family dithiol-disulfide isomerase
LLATARNLELDADEAKTALDERTFRPRVLIDVESGKRARAHGTPTFFIDGERVDGPWRRLAEIVPARLQGAGA